MRQKIIDDIAKKFNGRVEHVFIGEILDAAGYFELLDRAKRMCDRMYEEQVKMEKYLRKRGVPLG